jgi:hypothetical protein
MKVRLLSLWIPQCAPRIPALHCDHIHVACILRYLTPRSASLLAFCRYAPFARLIYHHSPRCAWPLSLFILYTYFQPRSRLFPGWPEEVDVFVRDRAILSNCPWSLPGRTRSIDTMLCGGDREKGDVAMEEKWDYVVGLQNHRVKYAV